MEKIYYNFTLKMQSFGLKYMNTNIASKIMFTYIGYNTTCDSPSWIISLHAAIQQHPEKMVHLLHSYKGWIVYNIAVDEIPLHLTDPRRKNMENHSVLIGINADKLQWFIFDCSGNYKPYILKFVDKWIYHVSRIYGKIFLEIKLDRINIHSDSIPDDCEDGICLAWSICFGKLLNICDDPQKILQKFIAMKNQGRKKFITSFLILSI